MSDMNPGAASPSTPMTDAHPMTIRAVRDYIGRVQVWVSLGYSFNDTMEHAGESYDGPAMVEDGKRAESFLFGLERKMKEQV